MYHVCFSDSEYPFFYIAIVICSININNKSHASYLDILALKTRGQRLGKLLGLLGILYLESVEVSAASDLELGLLLTLVDLDHLGIPAAGLLEEVADVGNFLGHGCGVSVK